MISADSKNGKTTMMLNLAEQYLSTKWLEVQSIYFYTYEEPSSHLALKLIMLMSGVMHSYYSYVDAMSCRSVQRSKSFFCCGRSAGGVGVQGGGACVCHSACCWSERATNDNVLLKFVRSLS